MARVVKNKIMNKIVILNGSSSAGKTSLVKAIQHLSKEFWLTFGFDSIIDAMPSKLVGSRKEATEGFHFVSNFEKGFPITEIKVGSIGEKASNLAPKIVKLLVDNGFNIIVDEVIWEKKNLESYDLALKNHQVYYVKVGCELSVNEEREILRGDRHLGMARFLNTKMRDLDWSYDLEIDTSQTNSFTNAKKILKFISSRDF